MTFPKPIITREHGSWAVLLIPMAVVVGTVNAFTPDAFLLLIAAMGVFMSYVPLHSVLREFLGGNWQWEHVTPSLYWGTIYMGVSLGMTVPLLMHGYWWLLGIGAVGAVFFAANFFLARRLHKTALTDFVAVAGLTLGAPAMCYVLTGSLDRYALVLYLLNLLFFGSSVFYVHMKISAARSKKSDWTLSERISAGKRNLVYHGIVVLAIIVFSIWRFAPAVAIVAFLPMIVHAVYGTYRLSTRVSFSRLGIGLLAQSILFSLLWIAIVHA